MTLLTICQNVADQIGLERPTSVVGSANDTARQMLALLKLEGALLIRFNWSALFREHEITTASGTASYALPSDYLRHVDNTGWDSTNYWMMRGSLTAKEWQFRKNAIISSAPSRKRYRLKWNSTAREVFIDPTPTATESLVIEYITNQYIEDSDGTGQSDWAADTDVPRIDSTMLELGLRSRVLQAKGIPYADEQLEYKRYLSFMKAQDVPNQTINLWGRDESFVNIAETGYGA